MGVNAQETSGKSLSLVEWLAIAIFAGFLLSIVAYSQFSKIHCRTQLHDLDKQFHAPVEIHLTGAVTKPGVYSVEAGTSVKKLLEQVELMLQANRKNIPFKKVFFSPQTLHIAEKKSPSPRKKKNSLSGN